MKSLKLNSDGGNRCSKMKLKFSCKLIETWSACCLKTGWMLLADSDWLAEQPQDFIPTAVARASVVVELGSNQASVLTERWMPPVRLEPESTEKRKRSSRCMLEEDMEESFRKTQAARLHASKPVRMTYIFKVLAPSNLQQLRIWPYVDFVMTDLFPSDRVRIQKKSAGIRGGWRISN